MSKCIQSHLDEKNRVDNGVTTEIIAHHSDKDIDVRFEDDTVVTNTSYQQFQNGCIANTRTQYHRIGEKKQMDNGMLAEIINYRSCNDIDVKFQDGTILKNRTYRNFKQGTMTPTRLHYNRIGEKNRMNNGLTATIIAYRNANDMDVKFENDVIVQNKSYDSFKCGKITFRTTTPVSKRIGEKQRMKNGMIAKIIEYRGSHDIDVEFEDGTIVKNRQYSSFKQGGIVISRTLHNRVGEKKLMRNGLVAEIITYRHSREIDIRFEDGTIIKNKQYSSFKQGAINQPTLNSHSCKGTLFHIQIDGIAYQLQQSSNELPTTYFNYIHPETNELCIGTVSDIHRVALNCKRISKPQLLVFK